jgi:aryl-alcohol dehydrogenase-like predicted oxidoreductase
MRVTRRQSRSRRAAFVCASARSAATARRLGIPITAYGLLSRGLMSGHWSRERERALDVSPDADALAANRGGRAAQRRRSS